MGILLPIFAFVGFDDQAVRLPLALFLIFGAAKLLAEMFERFGQPAIVGEILAGVLLGPSVLNWVRPGNLVSALAQMGAMFLLFRVGLEVKPSELFRLGGTALSVATLGVIFPFVAGWSISVSFGYNLPVSLFIGASMVATSVGITAQVLASKGLLDARASKVILAAAVIDDVLGLIVLAFVSGLGEGTVKIVSLITTAALASGFTFLVARFGAGVFERVVPRIEARLSVTEAQFNLALVVLFGLAVIAAYIGIAAIIGAFLAGLVFSEAATQRVQDLAHGITELMVPFFLVNIGLQLEIADFADRRILLLAFIILFAAIATKFVGCGLGAMRLGRGDAMRVGLGMMPRGEVGMVVAQMGLQLHLISHPIYATVVFMAVGTTTAAPPLLNLVFRPTVAQAGREDFSLG